MTNPPTSDTRRKVQELTRKGLTPREIAQILGISTQRVYQQLQKLKKDKAAS